MGAWVIGWGLGVSVAAPIGPVNVATIQLGLGRGFAPACAFGLGAASVDAVYCLAVYLGVAPLLVAAPWLRVVLYIAGALMLARMGWGALHSRIALASDAGRRPADAWRSYLAGVSLTAVNPATILSWLAIGGAALSAIPSGEGLALVIGIFSGSACWFALLSAGASAGRRLANERILKGVSAACGLALLGFAAVFTWGALTEFAAGMKIGFRS
ncbi:MAG TPA: LysE family transporter [Anaerolineae bacterium]|nr:LysE family transporter [Anaerolineae bacterium]